MSIKVEHTKAHHIKTGKFEGEYQYREILVSEGKIILIQGNVSSNHTRQLGLTQPILISESEKIEVGDWYYESNEHMSDTIRQCKIRDNSEYPLDGHKDGNSGFSTIYGSYKILALPEHFTPKQLQMIVDGKLKDGDKVLVECEKIACCHNYVPNEYMKGQFICCDNKLPEIKLNPHITIYSVEEKMYSKDQFIEALVSYRLDPNMSIEQSKQRWPNTWNDMKEVCNEWFEKNIK